MNKIKCIRIASDAVLFRDGETYYVRVTNARTGTVKIRELKRKDKHGRYIYRDSSYAEAYVERPDLLLAEYVE